MYKYCIVPKCYNTTISTPDKLFFNVPKDRALRKKWCKLMKRKDKTPLSCQSTLQCCEDHFDVESDMENYVKYKLVGGRLVLKNGVLPHKFDCQKEKKTIIKRTGYEKRRRIEYYTNLLSPEINHDNLQPKPVECKSNENNIKHDTDPIKMSEKICNLDSPKHSRHSHKGIKVNIKTKVDNKPTNSGCNPKNKVSPHKFDSQKGKKNAERPVYEKRRRIHMAGARRMQESQNGKLRLSSDVLIPESTNITLDQELLMDLHELSDKIQNFYPVLAGRQFTLCFKGDDGDKCEYIFTSASDTRRNGERHSSSRCDECKANIIGSRYKCVTCADYDLCSACEALGIHDQHIMMRITKPLKFKQAREMVQRCCDVMKAGDVSVDEIVGSTSGGDPANSSVEDIVEASTSKEAAPNKPKTVQKLHSTKPLFVKNIGLSKAKAPTTTSGAEDKLKKRNEDRKRKADASEDEEETRPTVKEEPDDTDLASCYNSFTDTEPFVAMEEVKLEDPDPLETEKTIKVEQPTLAGTSSWSADNYTESAAAVESSDTSRPEEDTTSVCLTYTHKRTKKSSDLNS